MLVTSRPHPLPAGQHPKGVSMQRPCSSAAQFLRMSWCWEEGAGKNDSSSSQTRSSQAGHVLGLGMLKTQF